MDDFLVLSPDDSRRARIRAAKFLKYYKNLDMSSLRKKGILSKDESPSSLVSKIDTDSDSLFRTSLEPSFIHEFWVSESKKIATEEYVNSRPPKFDSNLATRALGKSVAELSLNPTNLLAVKDLLAKYGILLIKCNYVSASNIDGVVFLLPTGNPVIVLSGRFKRLDSLWFTLLHELAHVIQHYDSLSNPIVENIIEPISEARPEKIERQANKLAKEFLISRDNWRSSKALITGRDEDLQKDSAQFKIHPVLLAGLIRFDKNNYRLFSKIIKNHTFDDIMEQL